MKILSKQIKEDNLTKNKKNKKSKTQNKKNKDLRKERKEENAKLKDFITN